MEIIPKISITKKEMVITTERVFGNFNLRLKKINNGLAIKVSTKAIVIYINTDLILVKNSKVNTIPVIIANALKIPSAIIFEFMGINIVNYGN